MSNSIENLKEKIEKVIQLQLLENKLNRINRIRINKIKEIIRKWLKEINRIKQIEEIGIELIRLEAKLIIKRMEESSEEFEIKILETEIKQMH